MKAWNVTESIPVRMVTVYLGMPPVQKGRVTAWEMGSVQCWLERYLDCASIEYCRDYSDFMWKLQSGF